MFDYWLKHFQLDPTIRGKEPVYSSKPVLNTGWVCPRCGKVYSPTVQQCWNCNNAIGTPTCQTTDP